MGGSHESYQGWGIRESDGRLVHVNDVPNGRGCGCVCPHCKSPLIARQGNIRTWHFAHASGIDCGSAGETALHLAAKQVLKDLSGEIFIPKEVIHKAGWPAQKRWGSKPMAKLHDLMTYTYDERRLSKWNVRIEPQDWRHQGFRPDAVLEKDDVALLIEIRVTHEVDLEKQRRMRDVGFGAIEIDLSEADRAIAPDDLESLIVSKAPRKWLVTGRKKAWKEKEIEFTKKLESEASRLNRMDPRNLTRHFYVNACPRRDEPGFESVSLDQCLSCEYCGGHLSEFRDTPIWNMLDERLRHVHENAVLCAYTADPINLPTEKQRDFVRELASGDLNRKGGLTACLPEDWEQDGRFCDAFISAHPDCGKCGKKMALRRNSKEQLFWGCSEYPDCGGMFGYSPEPPLDSIVTLHEHKERQAKEEDEKKARERAALARPEPGQASLSQLATPSSPRLSEG